MAMNQFSLALSMAVGARFKPMTMIIGPVTMGGSNDSMIWSQEMYKCSHCAISKPATIMPPWAAGIPISFTARATGAIKAKDEPKI